ncbi:hypothetical protein Tco_0861930 [Tanacetum coccineum]
MLPSNTETYPREELKAATTMSGLTLDGSFIPHSNFLVYQEEEQESETIMEVVEYPSSQSTPLVPPPETPQLTDIVDSLCDKFPIQNDQSSGSTTSHFDHSLLDYESFYFDVVLKEFEDLLYHGHLIDLPDIDNGIYDSEGDILFLEKLLEDEPSKAKKSEIDPLIREPSDTFLIGDKEIKFNPLKDIDDPVPIPRNKESDESETETIMDEVQIHSSQRTVQIPPSYGKHPFLLAGFPMIVKTTVAVFQSSTLEIPSDESKEHIEVLSVLWGNRLSFPDGSFSLTQKLKDHRT